MDYEHKYSEDTEAEGKQPGSASTAPTAPTVDEGKSQSDGDGVGDEGRRRLVARPSSKGQATGPGQAAGALTRLKEFYGSDRGRAVLKPSGRHTNRFHQSSTQRSRCGGGGGGGGGGSTDSFTGGRFVTPRDPMPTAKSAPPMAPPRRVSEMSGDARLDARPSKRRKRFVHRELRGGGRGWRSSSARMEGEDGGRGRGYEEIR
jgi:hypothetical protein